MRICEVLKTSAIIPELKGTNKEEIMYPRWGY